MNNKLIFVITIMFTVVCAFLLVLFLGSPETKKHDPVKVYVFGASGCPYCESQISYLKELDSYNKKFVIVEKELYVDHIDYVPGADYSLAHHVEETFTQDFSREIVAVTGTPYVVISNIYAKTGYNSGLDTIINAAYALGDTDTVGCISRGGTNCLISKKIDPKEYLPIKIIEVMTIITGLFLIFQFITLIRKK